MKFILKPSSVTSGFALDILVPGFLNTQSPAMKTPLLSVA